MARIAIDMDEVVAELALKHLEYYNRDNEDQLSWSELQGKKLWEVAKSKEKVLEYFLDPGFFRDLQVMQDSQEVIQELQRHHEIFIATAAMEVPASFSAKYEWLKEHFPFIPDKNIVFCGDKSIIHADYLIDDNIRHFENFCGEGILFTAFHNIHIEGYKRVQNWKEVAELFLS